MSEKPSSFPAPGAPATGGAAPAASPGAPPAPGVLTALVCERCGNTELIRVKACWYCEKCHYKFDCYGF
jgi:hypothetical protein